MRARLIPKAIAAPWFHAGLAAPSSAVRRDGSMRPLPFPEILAAATPALVLALALAATGCKHHQPPGAAAGSATAARTSNHACELLTGDDAEQLLGGAVKAPVTSVTAEVGVLSSRCGYVSVSTTPVKVVTLLARKYQQPADARNAFEHAHALAQTVSGQIRETVPGLGDRAYWAGGTVNQLNVLAGDTWLVISGTAGPGLDELGPAKLAAAKILAH